QVSTEYRTSVSTAETAVRTRGRNRARVLPVRGARRIRRGRRAPVRAASAADGLGDGRTGGSRKTTKTAQSRRCAHTKRRGPESPKRARKGASTTGRPGVRK